MSLLKVLVQVGRAVMAQWFKELTTTRKARPTAHHERDGVLYRFVSYRPMTLHGLFGAVTYQRAYYASGSGQGLAPLDERLGIKRRHTPGCQYFLSMFVAHQAHAEGRQFHAVFRADGRELLSVKKAFAMVRAVTGGLERQRQQEISAQQQAAAAPTVADPIGGTVAVSIDAAKVPVRGDERVDEAGKKKWGAHVPRTPRWRRWGWCGGTPSGSRRSARRSATWRLANTPISSSRGSKWNSSGAGLGRCRIW